MDDYRLHVARGGSVHRTTVDGGRPPVTRICEALSNERCRYVLYALGKDEPIGLGDLVDEVAQEEVETAASDVPDDVRHQLRVELHHCHLPKLCHLGIIEYDPRSKITRYREPPPYLEEFLQLTRKLDAE